MLVLQTWRANLANSTQAKKVVNYAESDSDDDEARAGPTPSVGSLHEAIGGTFAAAPGRFARVTP